MINFLKNPANGRFLDAWNVEAYNVNDQAQATGPGYFSRTHYDGSLA